MKSINNSKYRFLSIIIFWGIFLFMAPSSQAFSVNQQLNIIGAESNNGLNMVEIQNSSDLELNITGYQLIANNTYRLYPVDNIQEFIIPGKSNIIFANNIEALPISFNSEKNVLIQIDTLKLPADKDIFLQDQLGNEISSFVYRRNLALLSSGSFDKPIINNITSDSVEIRWNTDLETTSILRYGTDDTFFEKTVVDDSLTKSHKIVLNNLFPQTTYFFQPAVSVDKYEVRSSSTLQFTTKNKISLASKNKSSNTFDNVDKYFLNIDESFLSEKQISEPTAKMVDTSVYTINPKKISENSINMTKYFNGFNIAIFLATLFFLFLIGRYYWKNHYSFRFNFE